MRSPLAQLLVQSLDLQPHPEGGWYRQTWAAPTTVVRADGAVRPTATAILFLLPAGESSAWHRVSSDELWFAQQGRVTLAYGGTAAAPEETHVVTVDAEHPQALVPAGTWQRTRPSDADALVSCVVSPGFDFDDFELAGPTAPGTAAGAARDT